MNFYMVKDMQKSSKAILDNLAQNGEAIITNDGKPTALIIKISEYDFEDVLKSVRRTKAIKSIARMQANSKKNRNMTLDEINEEIRLAREEIKEKNRQCS